MTWLGGMIERSGKGETQGMNLHTDGPSQHGTAPGNHEPGERSVGGHPHLHGRPTSWLFVAVIIVAFVAGAFGVVGKVWPLFWVCLAVVVLSVPAGRLVGVMGDTVLAGDPAEQPGQESPVADDYGSAAHPGVEVGPTRAVTGERPAVRP
jgi:hypothetical protein